MKKIKLLLAMLMLAAMIVATVVLSSPYAPVVAPPAEIETIWDIEDAREESEEPLVTRLHNNGVPLAYDRGNNTFPFPSAPTRASARRFRRVQLYTD